LFKGFFASGTPESANSLRCQARRALPSGVNCSGAAFAEVESISRRKQASDFMRLF